MIEDSIEVNEDLKWCYSDGRIKSFIVYRNKTCTVARFIISKKKKKINYALIECEGSADIKDCVAMVENFIKEFGNCISEDRKDVLLPTL